MSFLDIIDPQAILCRVKFHSAKQAFTDLTTRVVSWVPALDGHAIGNQLALYHRDQGGAVGRGVAIFQAKSQLLEKPLGILATLSEPMDFQAVDHQLVDILLVLLLPDHPRLNSLKTVAAVSRTLKDRRFCDKLRGCVTAEALYIMLTQEHEKEAYADEEE